ncbi:hypothetical protein XH96_11755 [Bradyrhizobium sp. CCBAU 51765]|nr:hypothetical protein XH96_11755 [Bradyrhizobium sp. CCBAU 51765]
MLMIFSSRVPTVIASPIHVYATQQDATQDFQASSEQSSQLERDSREQSSASLPIPREELDVSGDRMIENFQRPEGTKVVITWERVR